MAKKPKSDVCEICGGPKRGNGYSHKPDCGAVRVRRTDAKSRRDKLAAQLGEAERGIAQGLAHLHSREVLLLASYMVKRVPSRVATDGVLTMMERAGIEPDKIAAVKAQLVES